MAVHEAQRSIVWDRQPDIPCSVQILQGRGSGKREAEGIKSGTEKRKINDGSAAEVGKAAENLEAFDVSGISLHGEDNNSVEVYDTPTEIRKEISAHLRKEGVT